MSSIRYKKWQCHDDRLITDQRDAVRRVLAFAGVHELDADDEIYTRAGSISDFYKDADPDAVWSIPDESTRGVISGGLAQWYKIIHVTPITGSFKATFTKDADKGGFLFHCSTDGAEVDEGYMVWWDGTHVGVGQAGSASDLTDLFKLPCAETGPADVEVGVTYRSHTKIDEIDDVEVSLWFDGKQLFVFSWEYEEYEGNYVGFAIYGPNAVVNYDNFVIKQACRPVDWVSVDPGDLAASSMSRILAHSGLRIQARYDGGVRLWRNDSTDANWGTSRHRFKRDTESLSVFWPSHLRVVGALHEVDNYRDGNQGHIFALTNDPNALTFDDVDQKSDKLHRQAEEAASTRVIVMPPNPLLEPEDVILIDGEKWRVVSFGLTATWQKRRQAGAPVLQSQYRLRKCLAE